jgi:hypothetical protein
VVKTYDPKTVTVIVGVLPIVGFAEGTVIKVSRSSDTFEKVLGIGGVVSRSRTLDKSGQITLTLAQTSLSNDYLSAVMFLDEYKSSGLVPIFIFDSGSKTTIAAAFAWIRKPPEVGYGKELSNREWAFEASDLDMAILGNGLMDEILG